MSARRNGCAGVERAGARRCAQDLGEPRSALEPGTAEQLAGRSRSTATASENGEDGDSHLLEERRSAGMRQHGSGSWRPSSPRRGDTPVARCAGPRRPAFLHHAVPAPSVGVGRRTGCVMRWPQRDGVTASPGQPTDPPQGAARSAGGAPNASRKPDLQGGPAQRLFSVGFLRPSPSASRGRCWITTIALAHIKRCAAGMLNLREEMPLLRMQVACSSDQGEAERLRSSRTRRK
jgi:hypothetical protein